MGSPERLNGMNAGKDEQQSLRLRLLARGAQQVVKIRNVHGWGSTVNKHFP